MTGRSLSSPRLVGSTARSASANPALPTVLALLAATFVIGFLIVTRGAGVLDSAPVYWTTWFDQGQYWRSAQALAHGNVSPGQNWYPPAYALVLAPLSWAGPSRAALAVNLALYLATYIGFERVAAHFGIKRLHAAILFLATTLALPGVGKTWLEPWTTTLSSALTWGAMAITADLILRPQAPATTRQMVALGVMLALIPCARPTDAVIGGLIGLAVAAHLLWIRRDARSLAVAIGAGLAVLIPYVLLYLAIWGPNASPYGTLGSAMGFDFARLGWKAYVLLIEPRPWFPYGTGMVAQMPWLLLGFAGALVLVAHHNSRPLALLLLVPALAYAAIMLAFIDLLPTGLWRFNNIHYFKWLFPLLGLFAWRWVVDLRARPLAGILALVVVLIASSVRMEPRAVSAEEPARLLVFTARPAPFHTVYMARSTVTDRLGSQRNFFDYHQIPDESGHILIASLRRDFVGTKVTPGADDPAGWPHTPPGFFWDGKAGAAPFGSLVARFSPRLTLGLPCWLPTRPCPTTLPLSPSEPARP